MDLKEIQALIKFVAKSGAQEVSLETEDFKINIKTGSDAEQPTIIQAMAPQAPVAMAAAPAPAAPAPAAAAPAAAAPADDKGIDHGFLQVMGLHILIFMTIQVKLDSTSKILPAHLMLKHV